MMRIVLVATALPLASVTVNAADIASVAGVAAVRLSVDTPVEAMVADAAGKPVLDAYLPGVTTHEYYETLKGMTLRQLKSMAPDKLTAEARASVAADLAQFK